MNTQFLIDSVEEILDRRAIENEALWLRNFNVGVHHTEQDFFKCQPDSAINTANTNYLHPNALTIAQGAGTPDVSGYALESFSHGAGACGSILSSQDADRASDLLKMQLGQMSQRALSDENPYPAIFEPYAPVYAGCVTVIMLGQESSTWHALLAYALGFVWMLGFITVSDEEAGLAVDVLLSQLKRGTYY